MAGLLTRVQTLVENQEFPSAVGNAVQDDCVLEYAYARGERVRVCDHFFNGTGNWTVNNTPGTASAAAVDDHIAGANGAIELLANAGGSSASSVTVTSPYSLNIGGDFEYSVRFRLNGTTQFGSGVAAESSARFGFFDDLASEFLIAIFAGTDGSSSSNNFRLVVGTSPTVDLGVPIDTAYHKFDVKRESGVVTLSLDSTPLGPWTLATSPALTRFSMSLVSPHLGSASGLRVDRAMYGFVE